MDTGYLERHPGEGSQDKCLVFYGPSWGELGQPTHSPIQMNFSASKIRKLLDLDTT